MRILVIEDEPQISELIREGLEEAGFLVTIRADGIAGYELATSQEFDAIVLDIMLPGRDGLTVLRDLRNQSIATPVIVLTARNELNERIDGLNQGADDYLTKPFYVEELSARLHALLRRGTGQEGTLLRIDNLSLDLNRRKATRGDVQLDLSHREFSLLEFLIRSPGRVYSRSQISQHVWNTHFDSGSNMVDVAVARLRRKVDDDFEKKLIETVRGVGYRIAEL